MNMISTVIDLGGKRYDVEVHPRTGLYRLVNSLLHHPTPLTDWRRKPSKDWTFYADAIYALSLHGLYTYNHTVNPKTTVLLSKSDMIKRIQIGNIAFSMGSEGIVVECHRKQPFNDEVWALYGYLYPVLDFMRRQPSEFWPVSDSVCLEDVKDVPSLASSGALHIIKGCQKLSLERIFESECLTLERVAEWRGFINDRVRYESPSAIHTYARHFACEALSLYKDEFMYYLPRVDYRNSDGVWCALYGGLKSAQVVMLWFNGLTMPKGKEWWAKVYPQLPEHHQIKIQECEILHDILGDEVKKMNVQQFMGLLKKHKRQSQSTEIDVHF